MTRSTIDLVNRFVDLDRQRTLGVLGPDDLALWEEMRDQLELATGTVRPAGVKRRDSIRVRTRLQVQVSWDAARELVRARDLSEGGVFLQTNHPIEPGTPVEIELDDLRGRPLSVEGTVAWVRLESDRAGAPGMGIRFRNLDDWDRTLLSELVEAALRSLQPDPREDGWALGSRDEAE